MGNKKIYLKIAVSMICLGIALALLMGTSTIDTYSFTCIAIALMSLFLLTAVICLVLYFKKRP